MKKYLYKFLRSLYWMVLISYFAYGASVIVPEITFWSKYLFAASFEDMQRSIIAKKNTSAGDFCTGSELFCEDWEGTDVSWDATQGTYDETMSPVNDGDYSDDYTTNCHDGECLAVSEHDNTTYYLREALSSPSGEFYIDFWIYSNDVTLSQAVGLYESGYSTVCVSLYLDGSAHGDIYYDNTNNVDAGNVFTINTWWHVRIYYKEETAAENNDGKIYVWYSTSDQDFDDNSPNFPADPESQAIDTGTNDCAGISFRGNADSGELFSYDNFKVVNGAPTMP